MYPLSILSEIKRQIEKKICSLTTRRHRSLSPWWKWKVAPLQWEHLVFFLSPFASISLHQMSCDKAAARKISVCVTGLHLDPCNGWYNDKHGVLGSRVTLWCVNLYCNGIVTMPKKINPSLGFFLPYHTTTAAGAQRG